MEERALKLVSGFIFDHLDKSDDLNGIKYDVFTVWKVKALQNWKFLISSTLPDGKYYEVTYNGDKKEWYIDAYVKFENKVVKDDQEN